jgi:hypothetical protein
MHGWPPKTSREVLLRHANADEAKLKNIIEMAFGFSAMTRVFEKMSTDKILAELESTFQKVTSVRCKEEFQALHDDFCRWFEANVKTAKRRRTHGSTKSSGSASYGQGAKVLDVALKVLVHYCQLPNSETAKRTDGWLNAAIDTQMMASLRGPKTIQAVTKEKYECLQEKVRQDIECNFQRSIKPVEWDDLMWRKLNGKDKG